jgi:hypothetical protein
MREPRAWTFRTPSKADVVIPPSSNAVENTKAAPMRNRNIQEIKDQGRMA